MKKLLIIGNFRVPLKGKIFLAPFYSLVAALSCFKAKQIMRREGGEFVLLCPQIVSDRLAKRVGLELVLWEEVSNFARRYAGTQNEELPEIFAYTEKVVGILEKQPEAHVKGISLPRAFASVFSLPHSEDFPYWVAGLQCLAQKFAVKKAIFMGGKAAFLSLARDALGAIQIDCVQEKSFFLGVVENIDIWIRRFIEQRAELLALRKFFHLKKMPEIPPNRKIVAMFATKPRSMRFLGPVIESLREYSKTTFVFGNVSSENGQKVGGSNVFSPVRLIGEKTPELAIQYQNSLRDIWRKSEGLIASLPDAYRGVKISTHCSKDVRRAWVQRGIEACLLADVSQEVFETFDIGALVLNDMLEGSYIFSKRAEERGIPRFFNYGVYSGQIATAVLWEHYFPKLADHFAVINSWMRDRLIESRIANSENVRVVGDVVLPSCRSPQGKAEVRDRVCERLALEKEKKIVLLLSRAISSALLPEDKKILFTKTGSACGALGVHLVIKGHPYEKRRVLEAEAVQWCSNAMVLIDELPLSDLVMAADVAVNLPASSTALDCMLVGTPVIIFGPQSEFDRLDLYEDSYSYRRHDAAKCLAQTEDILPVMREFLFDPGVAGEQVEKGRKFAERVSGPTDGKTSIRIAEWVNEKISG